MFRFLLLLSSVWSLCAVRVHSSTAPSDTVTDGEPAILVRLAASTCHNEGRLEVFYSGQWGTVCDDDFENVDAQVACYELGFGHNGYFIGTTYGAGAESDPIWLSHLGCAGHETSLAQCPHSGWGNVNCLHKEDVSVRCISGTVDVSNAPCFPNMTTVAQTTVPDVHTTDAVAQTTMVLDQTTEQHYATTPGHPPPPPPTTTTPSSAPDLDPDPYVAMTLNGTVIAADYIDASCSDAYSSEFRDSFEDVVSRANDAVTSGQLCPNSGDPRSVAGSIQFLALGTEARVSFTIMVGMTPSSSVTVRGDELCAWDVSWFVQNMNNWRQPIIPNINDCPATTFTPEKFDLKTYEWSCF